jgi:hypothetical protein
MQDGYGACEDHHLGDIALGLQVRRGLRVRYGRRAFDHWARLAFRPIRRSRPSRLSPHKRALFKHVPLEQLEYERVEQHVYQDQSGGSKNGKYVEEETTRGAFTQLWELYYIISVLHNM